MTRRSPSRTSTVLRSAEAINSTIWASRLTSIGLPVGAVDGVAGLGFFFGFCFSLNVATLKAPVERGKDLGAGVGNEDVVLDPHASFAGQVDARLDGYDHARAEFFFAADFAHGGKFVDFTTDAVPEAVAEFLAEAGAVDDVAGDLVGLAGGDAGAEERDGGGLGFVDDLVDLFDLTADSADHERAGQIAAIAF